MVKREAKEIDGIVFEVDGLDLKTERAVLVRLAKVVGPALASLARNKGTKADNAPQALRMLFDGLDEAEVDYLIEVFRKVTKFQMVGANGPISLPLVDAAFKGGAGHQLKWLWFCLEHQFTGFLGSISGGFSDLLGSMKAQAEASGSSSPQT